MYEKYWKRFFDFLLSLLALIILSPLLLILTAVGAIAMRGDPFFTQPRPGRHEKIFRLIKFRTMDYSTDKDGRLLPDEERLNGYGRFLRSTSLDELPELINILKGDMTIVGPRPLLVRDMVFMTPEVRRRHSVRQGLTGLAQVSGRNAMTWEKRFKYDLQYIDNGITFLGDLRIVFRTVGKVFLRDGIIEEGSETATDLGDYLLSKGEVTQDEYRQKLREADILLSQTGHGKGV